jgi:tetratricopeptide (TPR) repeat protein
VRLAVRADAAYTFDIPKPRCAFPATVRRFRLRPSAELDGGRKPVPRNRASEESGRNMFNWFRGIVGLTDEARQFQAALEQLERQAEAAGWTERAQLFNRAGDLCSRHPAERDLALAYYGRSIDAYLEAGSFESAAAMCRKLLRFAPQVVRAHCTLAFLSVRDRRIGDAERLIADYVAATRKTRTERFAIPRLRMMAEATDDADVRRLVGGFLLELRDFEGGERVLAALSAPAAGPRALDEQDRWNRLLRAAVMDPQELWERTWINLNTFRPEAPDLAGLHRVLAPEPGEPARVAEGSEGW